MKKLYLAKATILINEYMGESSEKEITRLVWAEDTDEAESNLRRAEENDDPYGTSRYVESIELHEAIGG